MTASPAQPPKLLDRVREACRVRHYSIRTEDAYVDWIRRFILFHNKRHLLDMGAAEMNAFLTHLAVDGHVAASTQNQAFSALLFLYRSVLEVEPGLIEGVIRAKRPERLPIVLSRDEVRAVLGRLEGVPRLIALLLFTRIDCAIYHRDLCIRFRWDFAKNWLDEEFGSWHDALSFQNGLREPADGLRRNVNQ